MRHAQAKRLIPALATLFLGVAALSPLHLEHHTPGFAATCGAAAEADHIEADASAEGHAEACATCLALATATWKPRLGDGCVSAPAPLVGNSPAPAAPGHPPLSTRLPETRGPPSFA